MSIDLSKMPKLGFGLMRLPEKEGTIDHEQVCRMVDKYMKAGMNYFDLYLLHSVEEGSNYETYVKYDCFNWGMKMKEAAGILD